MAEGDERFPPGLYELLVTAGLDGDLADLADALTATTSDLHPAEAAGPDRPVPDAERTRTATEVARALLRQLGPGEQLRRGRRTVAGSMARPAPVGGGAQKRRRRVGGDRRVPAHPVITVPVGVAATGRSKPAVNLAMEHLSEAGVLVPVATGRRNRSWEANGLLDLVTGLDAGQRPDDG